ncbi:MAG TPA: periplasmic heavy metal sensor [Pyrinomonadaceae bacterium]|nr:periplasmic heavy metal sensor [Pyrinomonadaceae bacterium]
MDNSTKSKWQVRLITVLIFLLGFAGGSLAFNVYHRWRGDWVPRDRRDRLEQMLDRLELTPAQREQVHQIFSETREQFQNLRKESEPRFEEIRRQTDERLQKVLTPEQWQKFQQHREETRRRRRERGPRD